MIKNPDSRQFCTYDLASDAFAGTLSTISYKQIYMVNSTNGNTMRILGSDLPEDSMKITLRGDGQWNVLPCLFDQTISLTQAMAGYYDYAEPGDIIKAHNSFATFTTDRHWEGNLTALHPGEGYLFRRMALGTVTVNFYDNVTNAPRRAQNYNDHHSATLFSNPKAANNMTMIATVQGRELQGAKVRVYVGAELAAEVMPIDSLYFITIQSDAEGTALHFQTEDGIALQPVYPSKDDAAQGNIFRINAHQGAMNAPVRLIPAPAQEEIGAYKIIENDHVVIIRNNEKYDVTGKKL